MSPLKIPSHRLHSPSGQAVVTLNGQHMHLGKHDTPESRAKYEQQIAEWLARGRKPLAGGDGIRSSPASNT